MGALQEILDYAEAYKAVKEEAQMVFSEYHKVVAEYEMSALNAMKGLQNELIRLAPVFEQIQDSKKVHLFSNDECAVTMMVRSGKADITVQSATNYDAAKLIPSTMSFNYYNPYEKYGEAYSQSAVGAMQFTTFASEVFKKNANTIKTAIESAVKEILNDKIKTETQKSAALKNETALLRNEIDVAFGRVNKSREETQEQERE